VEVPVRRLLLLMTTSTYRAKAFMRAAHRLGAEVIVGSERRQALARLAPQTTLTLDFQHPERAVEAIVALAQTRRLDAVVGVDDSTTLAAAMANVALSLPGNSLASVEAARNKFRMRTLLSEAGLPSPAFALFDVTDDPAILAQRTAYPCVLKPVFLSASRGVIRADDPAGFVGAFRRIKAILGDPNVAVQGGAWSRKILVESFIPGFEVALEGLLSAGQLRPLALFDKPDPLDGPFFEETIYVTPSRLPDETQTRIVESVAQTASALGLREGPVHAELRVNTEGVWVVEIAARSIGGLCSNVLRFGADISLEDLILRHALGDDTSRFQRERRPAGVMMLPIPSVGILRGVHGKEAAEAVDGIEGITLTIPLGQTVVPLPDGDRYLGFIFAHGATADTVESALRRAQRRLEFEIEPVSDPVVDGRRPRCQ
jgi:biotin carboxylase